MNEQQHLLSLIWNDDPIKQTESGFDSRGINIYRRNLMANAQRALSITFPTIFTLLDSDISENLAQEFLIQSPPDQGDWTQWGATFSNVISNHRIADDYPYLPDCAKLDWQVHNALHGKDQHVEQASLALLGTTDPENIKVVLNDNIALITTIYPINEIFDAHHHPVQEHKESAMQQAKAALMTDLKKHTVMVSRPEYQPKVTTLTHSDAEFMSALKQGKSLAESLDMVSHYDDFSFEKWLIESIKQNLIVHFKEN